MADLPPRLTFRPDIQGLRAVAVALVVLAHAGVPGFQGGYVGVDAFFVLSGYLITGLLLEEHHATGTIAYGRFLARRLRRLLPALLVMLVLVLVAAWVLLTSYEMGVQGRSFPYALTWTSNLFFAFGQRNYFDALEAQDLFLHTWSLGVEEQFYIIWPWLILLARGRSHDKNAGPALTLFAALFALSLAVCLFLATTFPILSFYMMPARGWQFALGAIVYVLLRARGFQKPTSTRNASLLGPVGLLLVLACAPVLDDTISYPGAYAVVPSIGAALIIAAGVLAPNGLVSKLLSTRPAVWLGDRSYSVYLWHWPVLTLGGVLSWGKSDTGVTVLVAATILLAAMSYRLVELPFWKGELRRAPPRQIALYSALSVLAGVSLNVILDRANNRTIAGPTEYDPRGDRPREIYSSGTICDTSTRSAEVVPCEIGNSSGKRLVIIWGDSVGVQWAPVVRKIYSDPQWRIVALTKSACAIVDHTYYYDVVKGDYTVCASWRENVLQYINDVRPNVVIMGSSAFYGFTETQWTEASARIFDLVSNIADRIVVIPGTPRLSFDGPACLDNPQRFAVRTGRSAGQCTETTTDMQAKLVSQYLGNAAGRFPNVDVLDLGDLVCPAGQCAAATVDGTAVYRDAQHLTVRFVETLLPEVRAKMQDLGIAPQSAN